DMWTKQVALSCYAFFHKYTTALDYKDNYYNTMADRLNFGHEKPTHPFDICNSKASADREWIGTTLVQVRDRQDMMNFYERMKQGLVTPDQTVTAYMTRLRIEKIAAPVRREIALQVATLPLTIFSGGAASGTVRAGTAVATAIAKRAAIAAARNLAVR